MSQNSESPTWVVQLFLRNHLYAGAVAFEEAIDAVANANEALEKGVVDQAVIVHRQIDSATRKLTAPQSPSEQRAAADWLLEQVLRAKSSPEGG